MVGNTFAIARRELSGFFFSPIAYVTIALFALVASLIFVFFQFNPRQPAEMRTFFTVVVWVLLAVGPAISMRLVAEEMRSGTIETLMTAPLGDAQVILGKWLGGVGFYTVMLLPSLVYVLVLVTLSDPDPGPVLSGYLGLLLVGGFFLAVGLLFSTLSRNQIIAYIATLVVMLVLTLVTLIVPRFLGPGWAWLAATCAFVNVNNQYEDFAKGVIDISNLVYFVSGMALFLVASIKALESRKWRG